MTTTAEHAKEIRTRLKAAGITSRDVSVRSDVYSMGSAIRVCIRTLDVPYAVVKNAADGHEHVRRDEQGEILSGGNMYVDVNIDDDAINAIADALVEDADGVRHFLGCRIMPLFDGGKQVGYCIPEGHHRPCEYVSSAVREIYTSAPNLAERICALAA